MRIGARRRRAVLGAATVEDLDSMLEFEPAIAKAPYEWLEERATSHSPAQINSAVEKLDYLKWLGADQWDLGWMGPNRLRRLAARAHQAGREGLARMPARRRQRHLVAFCADALVTLTDEVVDLFDRAIHAAEGRAEVRLDDARRHTVESASHKVELFSVMAQVLLDPSVADERVRSAIFARVPRSRLAAAETEADEVVRPLDDNHIELLAQGYAHLRSFVPGVLATLDLRSGEDGAELLEAVALLRRLDAGGSYRERALPPRTPVTFVPRAWRPHVIDELGRLSRRHWELCLLSQLSTALSSGQVWVAGSRRFADPMTSRGRGRAGST